MLKRFSPTQLSAALLVSTLLAAPVVALAVHQAAHARAELVSDTKTIVAGQPFTVAIAFDIDPKWHLYWKDPGDSGMPPSVKWNLPAGFVAGELQFPTPQILTGSAGTNYIYEDKVALLVTITPPADLKKGETLQLAGELKWLECDEDSCLPAKQSVAVGVVVADQVQSHQPEQFAQWKAAVEAGRSFDPKKTR